MDVVPQVVQQTTDKDDARRLLAYLRPYAGLLVAGIVLMMVTGAVEGLVAFAIAPALDIVLNPQSSVQKLALFTIPGTDHTIFLNSFVPPRIHYVWSVFSLALLLLFLIKGVAEFFGGSLIEYVGLSGITDMRNQVYGKLVQQPVGFFHGNPVGRVISAVISDIEQIRSVFSDYLVDFFRQIFTFVALICVLLRIDWRMAVGSAVLIPLVVYPVAKFGRKIRKSTESVRHGRF
jgi:ATP-binding cassette, subfamily B, bacterial MsbA